MRFLSAILFLFCLWSTAPVSETFAQSEVTSTVRWLDPVIDCSADRYPYYVNPFNVYAQISEVLKKRRPDGELFFSVNVVFGMCSEIQKQFIPEGSRNLTVVAAEKWPWQKLPFVKEIRAYEQMNTSGLRYNKLEIRVDEKLLAQELEKKPISKVTVNYHDFDLRGVRVRWIFEQSPSGIKARFEAIQ